MSIIYESLQGLVDDLESRIAELENKQRWISVKDKLPEYKTPYDYVLVCDADGCGYAIAWRDSPYEGGKVWCFSSDLWVDEHVTHWMPLPQLPEVKHA